MQNTWTVIVKVLGRVITIPWDAIVNLLVALVELIRSIFEKGETRANLATRVRRDRRRMGGEYDDKSPI